MHGPAGACCSMVAGGDGMSAACLLAALLSCRFCSSPLLCVACSSHSLPAGPRLLPLLRNPPWRCQSLPISARPSLFPHLPLPCSQDCVILRKPDGSSRGFGFVTYDDEVSVEKCLVMEHHLRGRRVDAKRAVGKESSPGGPGGGSHLDGGIGGMGGRGALLLALCLCCTRTGLAGWAGLAGSTLPSALC